jgi:tRNA pseudouridine55 synthase
MKDGILVVNKPEGISSAGVVGRLKRILGVKKIGHTGTLDPFATGVLLIAIGKATRISRFFLDGSKGYRAQVALGIETDTYDCTGNTTFTADTGALEQITQEDIDRVVAGFAGPQEQVAPAFSALKHQGQPLYKLARQGKMVQKPPRRI